MTRQTQTFAPIVPLANKPLRFAAKVKSGGFNPGNGVIVIQPDNLKPISRLRLPIDTLTWANINPNNLPTPDLFEPTPGLIERIAQKLQRNVTNSMTVPGFAMLVTPFQKKAASVEADESNHVQARVLTTLINTQVKQKLSRYFTDYGNHSGQLIKDYETAKFDDTYSFNARVGQITDKEPHFDDLGISVPLAMVQGPNTGIRGGYHVVVDAQALYNQHKVLPGHIGWAFNLANDPYYAYPPGGSLAHLTPQAIKDLVNKHRLVFRRQFKHPLLKKPSISLLILNNNGKNSHFATNTAGVMHGATPVVQLTADAKRVLFRHS